MKKLPGFCRRYISTLVLAVATPAMANVSDVVLRVNVRTAGGAEASTDIPLSAATFDAETNFLGWSLDSSARLAEAGTGVSLATILNASVTVAGGLNPNVELNCSVLAGTEDVICEVQALWLGFDAPAPASARGRATAAISVSDVDGNGATLRGLGTPGSGAFRATLDGGARNFTQLVAQVIVGSGGTAAGYQSDPAVGFRAISGTFAQMDSRLAFTLTRNDLASATTTYEVRDISEFQLFGDADLNCDANVTVSDITAFLSAITGAADYETHFPDCNAALADVDGNGVVSVGDIAAFVGVLIDAPAPASPQPSIVEALDDFGVPGTASEIVYW